ncbi:heavy-metal-associated domain-containing protein [Candidatus Poribacteria bacterium]
MAKTQTTLKVNGMSCEHCAGTVSKALKGLKGVKKANVNLQEGLAEVTYNPDKVSIDDLTKAVIDAGYEASAA